MSDIASRSRRVAPLAARHLGASGHRSYIPALAIDLDREAADRIASVERGTASSSMEFDALFSAQATGDAAVAACIRQKRAQPAFAEASSGFRRTVDGPAAEKFPKSAVGYPRGTGIEPEIGELLGKLDVQACRKHSP